MQNVLSESDDELDLSRPKYNFSLTLFKSRRSGKCGVCCRLTADMCQFYTVEHVTLYVNLLCIWELIFVFQIWHVHLPRNMKFFFFFWYYSPWWNLTSSKVVLHCSRSSYLRVQFLKPMFFRSSSSDSLHLTLGIPTRRVPSGLRRLSFMLWPSYWILKRCPSHCNLPIFITLTVCSSS